MILSACNTGGCSRGTPPKNRYQILFTSGVQGALEPCGCTADPLGGIARIGSIVSASKTTFGAHQIFIDGGNLLFPSATSLPKIQRCQHEPGLRVLGKAYEIMGVDHALLGPKDLAEGVPFAREFHRSYEIALFEKLVPVILDERIAIFGLESASPADIDALDAKAKALKEKRIQFVAAFVQGEGVSKSILSSSAHVDLFVLPSPENSRPVSAYQLESKGPYFAEGGNLGEYVGKVAIYLPSNGKVEFDGRIQKLDANRKLFEERLNRIRSRLLEEKGGKQIEFLKQQEARIQRKIGELMSQKIPTLEEPHFLVEFMPVTRSVLPEPAIQKRLDDYEAGQPAVIKFCEADKECPKLKEGEASYVGVQSCVQCHQSQHEFWKKAVVKVPGKDESGNPVIRQLGHSRAWETLVEKKKDQDPSCIGCHSIGYDKPGGYCKVDEVDFRKDVQCESCHGPGSKHVATGKKEFIKRSVPESTCRGCHHVPHIPTPESFNYDKSLLHITGPGHGVDLYNRLKHRQVAR